MISAVSLRLPYLIFRHLLGLLLLPGRTSTTKDVELVVLRHEVAVLRRTNPKPRLEGRIGPCSPRSSCQPSHPRPSPSRRRPDRSPPRVPGRSSWADATSGAWAATTSDRPVRQARSGVSGHPQRRRGQTRLGDEHGVAQPTTDHHIAGRVPGVRKAEILDQIAVAHSGHSHREHLIITASAP
jgi:hypothetical protein